MMTQGVRRLLVAKSVAWRGMSKRFSILYNGKWLKNHGSSLASNSSNINNFPSSSPTFRETKFCCLSREDVIRFLIGCLGALAPVPLSSISSLRAINPHFIYIEASSRAIEAVRELPQDPSAVAVVEFLDGQKRIIGEISDSKLWKCDYLAAAWALANLSAGQFVTGVQDNVFPNDAPDPYLSKVIGEGNGNGELGSVRPRKFRSRSIEFFSSSTGPNTGFGRNMYRGRSAEITCKLTSSLAAVMAQMLSHRATHVWVTDSNGEDDNVLVGVIGYTEILAAVTKNPSILISMNP